MDIKETRTQWIEWKTETGPGGVFVDEVEIRTGLEYETDTGTGLEYETGSYQRHTNKKGGG